MPLAGSLKLKNQTAELSRLNHLVEELRRKLQLTPAETYALNLALEEIVTNIIKYAYGEGVELPIEIRYCFAEGLLSMEVEDQGPAFNPLEAPPPLQSENIEDLPVGGLGIHIVRQLFHKIDYERKNEANVIRVWLAPKGLAGPPPSSRCNQPSNT